MINDSEKILKIIDDLQGDDRLIASPKVCYGIMEIREIIEASNSEKPNSSEPKQADFGFMDDTISRREALALIRSFRTPYRRELNVEDIYDAVLHMPSAQPEPFDDGYSGIYVKEEDVLKFYYVESEDDYWIGRRLDNFYYATWDRDLQNFVWSKSRHLPWGEHIVAPDTLWKEHTYPSEPKEIPLKDWLEGFYAKYFMSAGQPERKKGHWVEIGDEPYDEWECDVCGFVIDGSGCVDPEEYRDIYIFCPNCGAKMLKKGE